MGAAMRPALFLALLLIAGCSSPRDQAQADVDFLEKHGGTDEQRCDAYAKLVAADLQSHDSADWEHDRLMQRNVCLVARAKAQLRAEE